MVIFGTFRILPGMRDEDLISGTISECPGRFVSLFPSCYLRLESHVRLFLSVFEHDSKNEINMRSDIKTNAAVRRGAQLRVTIQSVHKICDHTQLGTERNGRVISTPSATSISNLGPEINYPD
jgi:hypothetical protein